MAQNVPSELVKDCAKDKVMKLPLLSLGHFRGYCSPII